MADGKCRKVDFAFVSDVRPVLADGEARGIESEVGVDELVALGCSRVVGVEVIEAERIGIVLRTLIAAEVRAVDDCCPRLVSIAQVMLDVE